MTPEEQSQPSTAGQQCETAMPRFRHKTADVTAERFWPDEKPWPAGVEMKKGRSGGPIGFELVTDAGERSAVNAGDWVISEADGKRYSLRDETFQAEFEPA